MGIAIVLKGNIFDIQNEKNNLQRHSSQMRKRLLKQIKSPKLYTSIAWLVFILFGFKKKFLVARKNKQTKKKALASITTDSIFGTKISYIDDFIVDRSLRWKGEGQKLFWTALE